MSHDELYVIIWEEDSSEREVRVDSLFRGLKLTGYSGPASSQRKRRLPLKELAMLLFGLLALHPLPILLYMWLVRLLVQPMLMIAKLHLMLLILHTYGL